MTLVVLSPLQQSQHCRKHDIATITVVASTEGKNLCRTPIARSIPRSVFIDFEQKMAQRVEARALSLSLSQTDLTLPTHSMLSIIQVDIIVTQHTSQHRINALT